MEERRARVVESIYENEALTADLDDAAGEVFLAWAAACGERIAQDTDGMDDQAAEEAMYPRLKALRKLARYLGRWVRGEAEALETLQKILSQAGEIYGQGFQYPEEGRQSGFVEKHSAADVVKLVKGLRQLIEGE